VYCGLNKLRNQPDVYLNKQMRGSQELQDTTTPRTPEFA
jgi:hypothetical protein